MITNITIKNFKGIKELMNLPLSNFHVLVGPNGSGKTTLLEAVDFVRDCLLYNPLQAVEKRGALNFNDLTWFRQGGTIEIELHMKLSLPLKMINARYKVGIKQDVKNGVCVEEEILEEMRQDGSNLSILWKTTDKRDFYQRETKDKVIDEFNFGTDKLALAFIPLDNVRYPTGNAVRDFLKTGIRYIQINSNSMRFPCPVTRGTNLELDGSNLARVVGLLLNANGTKKILWARNNSIVKIWAEHLQYALPDLENIGWARRQADNAEFILLKYKNGLEVPSWVLSDGTLRMLALTLPAFFSPKSAVYMVEEPENGVHPKALEIILRSLSSIPSGQTLLSTHSPFVVQQCGIPPLLCFSHNENGTQIIEGKNHPALQKWDGIPDIGIVFAAGVLE